MTNFASSFSNLVTPEFTLSSNQNVTLSGTVVGSGAGRSVSLYDDAQVYKGGAVCDANGNFSMTVNVQGVTDFHFYTAPKTVGADTYLGENSDVFTVKSLRFYDNFDYADAAAMFASGKWATRQPGYGSGTSGRTLANNSDAAVEVSGGQLKLKVLDDSANKAGGVKVGHITTGKANGLEDFVQGHIEASIKFHRFPGAHGGVWHQGSPNLGPGHAEWDVVEFFGERGPRALDPNASIYTQYVKNTVYTTENSATTDDPAGSGGYDEEVIRAWTGVVGGDASADDDVIDMAQAFAADYDIWNAFHEYHGYWGSTTYKFFVDGVLCGTINDETLDGGVGTQPGELILSLLVSDSEHARLNQIIADPDNTADWADYVMVVDWVRVWK